MTGLRSHHMHNRLVGKSCSRNSYNLFVLTVDNDFHRPNNNTNYNLKLKQFFIEELL